MAEAAPEHLRLFPRRRLEDFSDPFSDLHDNDEAEPEPMTTSR